VVFITAVILQVDTATVLQLVAATCPAKADRDRNNADWLCGWNLPYADNAFFHHIV